MIRNSYFVIRLPMKFVSISESQTMEIGKNLAQTLRGGDIVALHGDLGAGKTTLMKGIAAGLGVTQDITSPTFTLLNVYQSGKHQVVHIDTYRLKDEKELTAIGAEDFFGDPDTICFIEWPEKLANILKERTVKNISLEHVDAHTRRIILS